VRGRATNITTMIVKFKSIPYGCRDSYKTSSDNHKFTKEELAEVLRYKNIAKEFEYNDWYGSSTKVKVTLVEVEQNEWGNLIYTVECTPNIPGHYVPTPFEILEHRGLLFPTNVSRF